MTATETAVKNAEQVMDEKAEIKRFVQNLKLMMEKRNVTFRELDAILSPGELKRVFAEVDLPERKDLEIISKYLDVPVLDLTMKEISYSSFGEELRKLRVSCGFSREAVAEATGVSIATLARYEGDQSRPTSGCLKKLSTLYGEQEVDRLLKKYQVKAWDVAPTKKQAHSKKKEQTPLTMTKFDQREADVVADNLRRYRKKQGLSIAKLAAKCGTSTWLINMVTAGKLMPTKRFVNKLANVLNVSPSDLYVDRREEKKEETQKEVKKPHVGVVRVETVVEKEPEEAVSKTTIAPTPKALGPKTATATNKESVAPMKEIWADALALIQDDHEYRKACEALFAKLFNREKVSLEGMPQAQMFSMLIA